MILRQLHPMIQASLVSFNAAICSFVGSDWSQALCLQQGMLQLSMKQDVITINSSGQALVQHQWRVACKLLQAACGTQIRLSQTSFGMLINCHKTGQLWHLAVDAFCSMQKAALQINEVVSSSMVHASGTVWEAALAVTKTAVIAGTRLNLVCFSSLSSVLDRRQTWKSAVALVSTAVGQQVKLNKVLHNTACSACAKAARWDIALHLQRNMVARLLRADIVGFTSLISAVDSPSWPQVLAMLQHVGRLDVEPNNLSFNAASDRLVKSGQWNCAFRLLDRMQNLRAEMDVFTYSVAWTGYRRAGSTDLFLPRGPFKLNRVALSSALSWHKDSGQWGSAMAMLAYMYTLTQEPDLVAHSSAIGACCQRRWQIGLLLWLQLPLRRVEADAACTAQVLEAAVEHQAACAPALANWLDAGVTSLYAAEASSREQMHKTAQTLLRIAFWMQQQAMVKLEFTTVAKSETVMIDVAVQLLHQRPITRRFCQAGVIRCS